MNDAGYVAVHQQSASLLSRIWCILYWNSRLNGVFWMGSVGESYVRSVGGNLVSSIITDTPSMRIEVLRRETAGRMHWHFRQPELSLFWFGKGPNA